MVLRFFLIVSALNRQSRATQHLFSELCGSHWRFGKIGEHSTDKNGIANEPELIGAKSSIIRLRLGASGRDDLTVGFNKIFLDARSKHEKKRNVYVPEQGLANSE